MLKNENVLCYLPISYSGEDSIVDPLPIILLLARLHLHSDLWVYVDLILQKIVVLVAPLNLLDWERSVIIEVFTIK